MWGIQEVHIFWSLYYNRNTVWNTLADSCMELSPSREAANCAATQRLFSILWNQKVYYRVRKSPPLVRILSHMNPVHTIPSYLCKIILILSTHLRLGLSSGLFPSGFRTNTLYAFLFWPIRATCPTHLILHDLIILIIQVMKLLIMQFSPTPRHFVSLRIHFGTRSYKVFNFSI
jgi:hypothetical protein